MQCPYCGNEMEAGHIHSSKAIFWGEGPSMWDGKIIRLSKFSLNAFFDGFTVEAQRCGSCKKLIVSLEDAKE